jgi:KDO2-lipid IV(A) lauroyltransferase
MWVVWFALKAAAKLPFASQLKLGRRLGPWFYRIKKREARFARRNLAVCFPELNEAEREALLTRHFEAVGMSFMEMAIGWFSPLPKLRELIELQGRSHLDAGLTKGNGVLLVGAHFTTVETCASIFQDIDAPISCMYRPQRNPMMDVMIQRGRSRFADTQIPRDNVRMLLKRLRQNDIVLYMPDQTYLGNQSALLPFFGETAVTNIATSKLASISGAVVLPMLFSRRADDKGYVVKIGAPLDNFPSDDPAADTLRLVEILEAHIRRVPEQYLWLYKKFKARPAPYPDLYRN